MLLGGEDYRNFFAKLFLPIKGGYHRIFPKLVVPINKIAICTFEGVENFDIERAENLHIELFFE